MRAVVLLVAVAGCGRLGFTGHDDPGAPADAAPDAKLGLGTWEPTPPSPLAPRVFTTAVWTGSAFLVFGGALDTDYNPTNTGALYDPVARTWTPVSTTNAPPARHTARLAVIGDTIVEYGGGVGFGPTGGGGRYHPATDTWLGASTTNEPGARIYAAIAVAGGRVATWGGWQGGPHASSGGLYDPATDTWTPMTTTGAPAGASFATMVWTGSRLIVWGGCDGGMPSCPNLHATGGIYDPATDTWAPVSTTNAPEARAQHVAVWTGTEMLIWGGTSAADEATPLATGAAYDPTTDTWRQMAVGAPARIDPAVAWLGDAMAIWGSDNGQTDGYLYDPAADRWERWFDEQAPSPRSRFAYAANDHQVFIWGGSFTAATGAVWTRDPEP